MADVGAPIGNDNNMKWKTVDERIAACERYCTHLKKGLSKDCWSEASYLTIQRYIKDFPIEFKADMIDDAERIRKASFENCGIEGMYGQIPGFSAPTWKFQMQNICGWKDRSETEHSGGLQVTRIELPQDKPIGAPVDL